MSEDLAGTQCGKCRQPVFVHARAVQCARCAEFYHPRCWTESGRCSGKKCKSKDATKVVVVQMEARGPALAEITSALRAEFEQALHSKVADLVSRVAHHEDVAKLRKDVDAATQATVARDDAQRDRLAELVAGLARRMDEHQQALSEIQRLLVEAPGAGAKELAEFGRSVTGSMEQRTDRLREEIATVLAALERVVVVEAHRNLVAIEACRWDTAARRRPLPWDDRSERVLDSAPMHVDPLDRAPGERT